MSDFSPHIPRTKPKSLRPGDKIGIVAPASNIKGDLLEKGCAALRALGYEPLYLDSILEQDLYFAGSAKRRARELEEMFVRDDVRAIVCARGGYGSNYLLGELDPAKIAGHPKIFVAYSDITTLLTCFRDAARFVTFHGPMVTKDFAANDGVDMASWQAALTGVPGWEITSGADSGMIGLADGGGEGTLYGGCLSILVESLGTPHEIRTNGTILFLEDVNAKPFQVDRMLMHLKLAGKLSGVKGVVFGEMLNCSQHPEQGYTLQEVLMDLLSEFKFPILYGFSTGHTSRPNVIVPFGVRARLDLTSSAPIFELLESAVA